MVEEKQVFYCFVMVCMFLRVLLRTLKFYYRIFKVVGTLTSIDEYIVGQHTLYHCIVV